MDKKLVHTIMGYLQHVSNTASQKGEVIKYIGATVIALEIERREQRKLILNIDKIPEIEVVSDATDKLIALVESAIAINDEMDKLEKTNEQ